MLDPVLNARSLDAFFTLPSRIFQRTLPLKGSDSIPKPVVLVIGDLLSFSSFSSHEVPIQAMD